MLMSDKTVVIAIFKDEVSAKMVAASLKDSGLVQGDAIGVLVLNKKGKVKTKNVGMRSVGMGAGIRLVLAVFTRVAGYLGPVSDSYWARFTTCLGLFEADRMWISRGLADGKAAVGVLAPVSKADSMVAELSGLGGAAEALSQFATPDEKSSLIAVARPAEVIGLIEKQIENSARRYRYAYWIYLILAVAASVWNYFLLLKSSSPSNQYLLSAVLALIFYALLMATQRSSPEYRTFYALLSCITRIDDAMESKAGARKRQELGKQLLWCARMMRTYRPFFPFRLHKRIMRSAAIRGSRALRKLVYPTMLGTDEELRQVKEILARAAIDVGTADWVLVGDLDSEIKEYPVSKSAPAWVSSQPLLAFIGFAVVAIPLVSALIKL